jgi:phage tail sheath gpL-like
MAPVPFNKIPGALRIPGFFAEVNASKANTSASPQRALIVGQITGAGVAAPNVPLLSQGPSDAITQGVAGSMLALMTAAFRKNNSFTELWYLPLADAGGAVAASGSIAFTGPATAAGVLALYIAAASLALGDSVPSPILIPVTNGMSGTALGAAVAAAITALPNLPVIATATTGTVTVTAKNAGLAGNDIDIRLNYQGTAGGESLPAGIGATITALSGGATNPTLTTALANLVDKAFDFIVTPYTDATSIAALTAFMNDTTGRWSWNNQIYGHVFGAYRGSSSALATFGTGLNDPHASFVGFFDSPTPSWIWAAAAAGAVATALSNDYTAPITGMAGLGLQGVLAPPLASRFLPTIRNTLLYDGIATFKVNAGQVFLESMITTYQLNSQGQADNSYLKAETLFSLMFNLRDLANFVSTNWPNSKLAADGAKYAPGVQVATPKTIAAGINARYRYNCGQGFAQNAPAFAAGLVVQKNTANQNRVDVLFDPILINTVDTLAALAQFRLAA